MFAVVDIQCICYPEPRNRQTAVNPAHKGNQPWQKHPRPDPPRSSSCLISREKNGVISGSAILNTIRRLCSSRKNICVIPEQSDPACSETSRVVLWEKRLFPHRLTCTEMKSRRLWKKRFRSCRMESGQSISSAASCCLFSRNAVTRAVNERFETTCISIQE